jgi:hypothetical protein
MPLRKTLERKPLADPDVWDFLHDRYPSNSEPYNFEVFSLLGDSRKLESLWREYRSEILPAYVQNHSGRRPSLWYQFDSPRQQDMGTDAIYEGTLPAYRRIIQGDDFPTFCVWRYKGVPVIHSDKDILVENECSFLRRYNLLTEEEIERLQPEDFEKVESFHSILSARMKIKPY